MHLNTLRFLLPLAALGAAGCGAKPATTAPKPRPSPTRPPAPRPAPARPAPRLVPVHPGSFSETGDASYYGEEFAGRPTASGEKFDPELLTAAHRTLPLGTELEVTHLESGVSVIVRVNDRGPFVRSRILDCSTACAEQLGYLTQGTARVGLKVIKLGEGKGAVRKPPTARPSPSPVPPAAPAPGADAATEWFAIQAGAFSQRANAEAMANRFIAQGQAAYIESDRALYRVKLGPFTSEAAARRALDKLDIDALVVREDHPPPAALR